MRKVLRSLLLAGFLLLAPVFALGDQITFSFVASAGNAVDLMASKSTGMQSGPATNIAVSDTTLGVHLPLDGTFTSSAGAASAFTIASSFVFATFTAGGTDSVLITDPMGNVLVAGTMQDNGAVLAQYPGGTGSYLGTFTVTEVDPAVLADFGLSGFNPSGSVAFTFGQDHVNSLGVLDAVVGGGTVTIVGTVVPEPASLALAATGLLALCLGVFRMNRWPKKK